MSVYEKPSIKEIGSVAAVTRGSGSGPEWDGIRDFLDVIFDGDIGTSTS